MLALRTARSTGTTPASKDTHMAGKDATARKRGSAIDAPSGRKVWSTAGSLLLIAGLLGLMAWGRATPVAAVILGGAAIGLAASRRNRKAGVESRTELDSDASYMG